MENSGVFSWSFSLNKHKINYICRKSSATSALNGFFCYVEYSSSILYCHQKVALEFNTFPSTKLLGAGKNKYLAELD